MSANASTGSPSARGRPSAHFSIHDDMENTEKTESLKVTRVVGFLSSVLLDLNITNMDEKDKHGRGSSDGPSPLSTSKLGNLQTLTTSASANTKVIP